MLPFLLTPKESGWGWASLTRPGCPTGPCCQQDSPHEEPLTAGGGHEGGEDQEGLRGGWGQTSLSP